MNKYLIIDDEPLIRKGLAKLISRVSPDWTMCGEADNGLEGLDMIQSLQPDLVFTDIRMPDMDGLTMNRLLIEQAIPVPIVFFTGHDEFSYIQQAIRQNAFDYLLKPVQEAEVRRLFAKYEQEFAPRTISSQRQITQIQEYESFLSRAFETRDEAMLAQLRDWYEKLKDLLPIRSFVELTNWTVQNALWQHGLFCHEFKPVISDSNTERVLQKLQEYCQLQMKEAKKHTVNQIIEKVKAWVDTHIDKPVGLKEAAELVHFNPTYFSEYFKQHVGETFSQYVLRQKIRRAKTLLADQTLRIRDVALMVGYTDHRHFSKVFYANVGLTPSKYRNLVLGIEEPEPDREQMG
jgi:two-component system response regulator YesN